MNERLFRHIQDVVHEREMLPPPRILMYKTAEEKRAFATTLRSGAVRPYLSRYAASIQPEIEEVLAESLAEFCRHTDQAWQNVIAVNKEVDAFLYHESQSPFGDWSPVEIAYAIALLKRALKAEHEKNVYSSAIKRKLDQETDRLVKKFGLTEAEKHLLVTPGFATFHEQYHFDHMRFHLSPEEAMKQALLARYHADDPELLEERLRAFAFSTKENNVLLRQLQEHETKQTQTSTQKYYLLIERPELKQFEWLLRFDNLTEYEYAFGLAAYPEIFLRERLLALSKMYKIVDAETTIFSLLKWTDWEEPLRQLMTKMEKTFRIRLSPYAQTANTCGTACVMSVLHTVGVPLTRTVEYDIWNRVGAPYNFPGGMALELMKYGFLVDDWNEPDQLFTPEHPDLVSGDESMFVYAHLYVDLFERAVERGMNVSCKPWGFQDVLSNIRQGNVCIVGVGFPGIGDDILHWVIARGYEQKADGSHRIEILDPMGSLKWLTESQMEELIDTSMGKRLLVVRKFPAGFLETPSY